MTSRWRALVVNWGLVLAAGFSVLAVVITEKRWTSAERTVRSEHLVVGFRRSDIQRVMVQRGGEHVVIERGVTGEIIPSPNAVGSSASNADSLASEVRWRVTQPYQGEAEEVSVDSLLRAIEFATVVREVNQERFDRRGAGLDDPVQVVEIFMGDVRTRVRLGAGAPSPAGAHYVEIAGEGTANKGVYVVSKTTFEELSVELEEFRVRQLVPYSASGLQRVTLSNGAGKQVKLTQQGDGPWMVARDGKNVRLAHSAWERLFTAFSRSQAVTFLDAPLAVGDPGVGGAEEVDVVLVPRAANSPTAHLRIGGTCPGDTRLQLARRLEPQPVVACTKPLFIDSFLEQSAYLGDTQLFSFRPDEVEELRITEAQTVLELARREQGWTMRQPLPGDVEREVGNARVEAIVGLRGELASGAPPRLLNPRVVQLSSSGDTAEHVRRQSVEMGRASDPASEEFWVHRLEDDAWLKVSPSAERLLRPSALLLKRTQLIELDTKQIDSFSLATPEWKQAVRLTQGGAGCQLVAPDGYTVDQALCVDVIDGLRTLRAQTWVSATDDGTFGLDQPTVVANIDSKDGRAWGVRVGARAGSGGYYATLDSDPAVFTLSESVVNILTTLLVDRSPFMLDVPHTASLRVRGGERMISLGRLGDELLPLNVASGQGQRSETPSVGRTQSLVDALATLRPEAAVALLSSGRVDAAVKRYGFDVPVLDVQVNRRRDVPPSATGVNSTELAATSTFRWLVGAGDVYRGVSVYYAMVVTAGPSAVFVLPRDSVQRLLDSL